MIVPLADIHEKTERKQQNPDSKMYSFFPKFNLGLPFLPAMNVMKFNHFNAEVLPKVFHFRWKIS